MDFELPNRLMKKLLFKKMIYLFLIFFLLKNQPIAMRFFQPISSKFITTTCIDFFVIAITSIVMRFSK